LSYRLVCILKSVPVLLFRNKNELAEKVVWDSFDVCACSLFGKRVIMDERE